MSHFQSRKDAIVDEIDVVDTCQDSPYRRESNVVVEVVLRQIMLGTNNIGALIRKNVRNRYIVVTVVGLVIDLVVHHALSGWAETKSRTDGVGVDT